MTPMFSTIRIDQLEPSHTNPRKTFDEAAMSELTRSVQAQGILQPILVRPTGKRAAIGARLGSINKRQINADEKLKAVFDGKDSLTMFDMTKAISSHLQAAETVA